MPATGTTPAAHVMSRAHACCPRPVSPPGAHDGHGAARAAARRRAHAAALAGRRLAAAALRAGARTATSSIPAATSTTATATTTTPILVARGSVPQRGWRGGGGHRPGRRQRVPRRRPQGRVRPAARRAPTPEPPPAPRAGSSRAPPRPCMRPPSAARVPPHGVRCAAGLFRAAADGSLYPDPAAPLRVPEAAAMYEFVGAVLAKTLQQSILLELPLARAPLEQAWRCCDHSMMALMRRRRPLSSTASSAGRTPCTTSPRSTPPSPARSPSCARSTETSARSASRSPSTASPPTTRRQRCSRRPQLPRPASRPHHTSRPALVQRLPSSYGAPSSYEAPSSYGRWSCGRAAPRCRSRAPTGSSTSSAWSTTA